MKHRNALAPIILAKFVRRHGIAIVDGSRLDEMRQRVETGKDHAGQDPDHS